MNSGISTDGTRLFTPFFDEVDMIASFPADTTLAEVNRTAAAHGLHFPLVIDPAATLRAHLAAAECAPASARFGAYVDNLPGMNWQLAAGKAVRVGERVVKSTTGYDLFRFLLHSGERYGRATEYVLRLRPISGEIASGVFTGGEAELDRLRSALLASSWSHWIDSINWVTISGGAESIEVRADCQPGEEGLFIDFFSQCARESGAVFQLEPSSRTAGLPAFTVKSTPGHALTIARECARELGGFTRTLALNGLVLAYPERCMDDAFLAHLRSLAEAEGGHVFGQSVPPREPNPAEKAWINQLQKEWSQL